MARQLFIVPGSTPTIGAANLTGTARYFSSSSGREVTGPIPV